MLSDLDGQISRVADFMGITMDAELRAITNEMSSFKYMSTHASQFDDHFVFNAGKKRMGRADYERFTVGKVRKGGGKAGSSKAIPASVLAKLKEKWAEVIASKTGCADYAAFKDSVSAGR